VRRVGPRTFFAGQLSVRYDCLSPPVALVSHLRRCAVHCASIARCFAPLLCLQLGCVAATSRLYSFSPRLGFLPGKGANRRSNLSYAHVRPSGLRHTLSRAAHPREQRTQCTAESLGISGGAPFHLQPCAAAVVESRQRRSWTARALAVRTRVQECKQVVPLSTHRQRGRRGNRTVFAGWRQVRESPTPSNTGARWRGAAGSALHQPTPRLSFGENAPPLKADG